MKMMLNPEAHSRLISDLENISSTAGVQPHFLQSSMTEYCGEVEVDWVRNFKGYQNKGVPGLVLEGIDNPDSRCQAIAGALLRNYIDARVIPLGTLIDAQQDGGAPNPSVILVPNFFVKLADKGIPGWRMQGMYDLLLHRASHGKPSVLYVQNKDDLEKAFGVALVDLLSHFRWVKK